MKDRLILLSQSHRTEAILVVRFMETLLNHKTRITVFELTRVQCKCVRCWSGLVFPEKWERSAAESNKINSSAQQHMLPEMGATFTQSMQYTNKVMHRKATSMRGKESITIVRIRMKKNKNGRWVNVRQ